MKNESNLNCDCLSDQEYEIFVCPFTILWFILSRGLRELIYVHKNRETFELFKEAVIDSSLIQPLQSCAENLSLMLDLFHHNLVFLYCDSCLAVHPLRESVDGWNSFDVKASLQTFGSRELQALQRFTVGRNHAFDGLDNRRPGI